MTKRSTVLGAAVSAAAFAALACPVSSVSAAPASSNATLLVPVASGGWATRAEGKRSADDNWYGGAGYGYRGYGYGPAPVPDYGYRQVPYGYGYGYDGEYDAY